MWVVLSVKHKRTISLFFCKLRKNRELAIQKSMFYNIKTPSSHRGCSEHERIVLVIACLTSKFNDEEKKVLRIYVEITDE